MIGEVSVYGLYLPWLLVLCLLSMVLTILLSRLFARLNLYRLVWHPALFDCALFVIVLGAVQLAGSLLP